MFARVGKHMRSNVVAYLALFVALGGTGAYAASTIGSDDVINESLLSQDFANGSLSRFDLAAATLTGTYVLDESLSFHDFAPGTIVSSRLADNAVGGAKVANNTITGDDVDDSTLDTGVVQRVRQTSAANSSDAGTTVARTGGSWTQAAGEVDHFIARATVTAPAGCLPSFIPLGELKITVGTDTLVAKDLGFSGTGTQTIPIDIPGLPSPETDTVRTLNAVVTDSCAGADVYTVSNLKVDVVGIK